MLLVCRQPSLLKQNIHSARSMPRKRKKMGACARTRAACFSLLQLTQHNPSGVCKNTQFTPQKSKRERCVRVDQRRLVPNNNSAPGLNCVCRYVFSRMNRWIDDLSIRTGTKKKTAFIKNTQTGPSRLARRKMPPCSYCATNKASLQRPKTGDKICKPCFFHRFEEEIHDTIVRNRLFRRGERVCIAASGGKDSTVLAHVLTTLNERHDYGLDLFLLSIDEGITGYRDDSLEVRAWVYSFPLKHSVSLIVCVWVRMCMYMCVRVYVRTCVRVEGGEICHIECADGQTKPARLPDTPQNCVIRGIVRLDHGSHRSANRIEKQLHVLRCISPTSARSRCLPHECRQDCDRYVLRR
jgi:hypothetical protein